MNTERVEATTIQLGDILGKVNNGGGKSQSNTARVCQEGKAKVGPEDDPKASVEPTDPPNLVIKPNVVNFEHNYNHITVNVSAMVINMVVHFE
ncbi:uncharacterized protein A4U43_C01F21440 [Asparagus officinalis]|uniref:Uncharacterized protein n=1 Tax=Asparagus officinalis TaxID=4686 RepID=A0A5P1FVH4_ASPOF|nr:uncharacterized protein A4U43_C01F21440 [Asparagus officinalis]